MTPSAGNPDKMDSVKLIRILKKWKKHLIVVFIASLLISFVFTLPVFMKPMFKSSAVLYPVNLQPYSNETPTEQMIQLFNSEEVRLKLVNACNLYEHYEIDPQGKFPRFEILKKLDENISIDRTQYESVEIDVLDTDPEMAAKICDSLIRFMDVKAIELVRERASEVEIILGKQLREKKAEMDSMENRMQELRTQYGITDFELQIEGFSREYYRSVGQGGSGRLEQIRKNLEDKGGEYVSLRENLESVRQSYNEYKLRYEQIIIDLSKELTFHNVVTKPDIPERKDSPKRSVIMVLFTLSMMLLATLVILYEEHYSKKLAD